MISIIIKGNDIPKTKQINFTVNFENLYEENKPRENSKRNSNSLIANNNPTPIASKMFVLLVIRLPTCAKVNEYKIQKILRLNVAPGRSLRIKCKFL